MVVIYFGLKVLTATSSNYLPLGYRSCFKHIKYGAIAQHCSVNPQLLIAELTHLIYIASNVEFSVGYRPDGEDAFGNRN